MEELKDDELAKFHKRKRKRRKIVLATLTVVFIIISLISISKYCKLNKKSSIKFTETSNIDYGINLKENPHYKTNRLGENIDVIAEIIKDMEIEFKYNLNLAEEIDYIYSYKILANIELKEKSKTNLIYSDEQEVINKEKLEGNTKRLEIVEKMNLVYNDYNDQINQLISEYKLNNTESELSLVMKLNVVNKATGEKINKVTDVMTITIPLDTTTVEIAVNENVKDTQGEIILKGNDSENSKKYLNLSIVMLVLGLVSLICLLRYNSKTRSAEKMYEKELNKIMFDYKSYVQKISTPLDYNAYKIVKIGSFAELLQMREEIQSPILMYTEKNQMKTVFMMMKDDLLFTYILSSKSIRKKLIEESKKRREGKQNEQNQ